MIDQDKNDHLLHRKHHKFKLINIWIDWIQLFNLLSRELIQQLLV